MNNLPEIRIRFSKFLDPVVARGQEDYPDSADTMKKIEIFSAQWKKCEAQILEAITKVLKLSYKQNIIDVYVVGKIRAFSDPMVISSQLEPDSLIDVLTHELLHRLISDNTADTVSKIGKQWDELYSGEERLTLNHILVHAVSQHVYFEVWKDPLRLARDIENCQKNPPYARSWEIVRTHGYKNIIKSYLDLVNEST